MEVVSTHCVLTTPCMVCPCTCVPPPTHDRLTRRHVQAASLPLVASTALMAFRKGNLAENKKVLVTGGCVESSSF